MCPLALSPMFWTNCGEGLGVKVLDQSVGMVPEKGMELVVPLFCQVLDKGIQRLVCRERKMGYW